MLVAIAPLVFCLAGLLMFALGGANTKVVRIGEIMFAAGLLVSLWFLGAKTWRVG